MWRILFLFETSIQHLVHFPDLTLNQACKWDFIEVCSWAAFIIIVIGGLIIWIHQFALICPCPLNLRTCTKQRLQPMIGCIGSKIDMFNGRIVRKCWVGTSMGVHIITPMIFLLLNEGRVLILTLQHPVLPLHTISPQLLSYLFQNHFSGHGRQCPVPSKCSHNHTDVSMRIHFYDGIIRL